MNGNFSRISILSPFLSSINSGRTDSEMVEGLRVSFIGKPQCLGVPAGCRKAVAAAIGHRDRA